MGLKTSSRYRRKTSGNVESLVARLMTWEKVVDYACYSRLRQALTLQSECLLRWQKSLILIRQHSAEWKRPWRSFAAITEQSRPQRASRPQHERITGYELSKHSACGNLTRKPGTVGHGTVEPVAAARYRVRVRWCAIGNGGTGTPRMQTAAQSKPVEERPHAGLRTIVYDMTTPLS